MTTKNFITLFRKLVLLCVLGSPVAFADIYQVSVDTSSLAGTEGYVDFQLNPADISAPSASVEVANLLGSITLLAIPDVVGDVTGILPGTLTLTNSAAFNDYFQSVQFGSSFTFLLDISGDFLNQSSLLGSSFALALYAADGVSPLLSTDASGSIVIFELANQAISYQIFADENSNYAAQVTAVPLPAAAWLLLSGLMGLVRIGRKNDRLHPRR